MPNRLVHTPEGVREATDQEEAKCKIGEAQTLKTLLTQKGVISQVEADQV